MTSPLSPEAVAQMVADREAGTPGPWAYRPDKYDDWGVVKAGHFVLCQVRDPEALDDGILSAHRNAGTDTMLANARRIARLPDIEAAYLTLASENATLRSERDAAQAGWDDQKARHKECFSMSVQNLYRALDAEIARDTLRASEAAALERISTIEDALSDPIAVHANMLRGTIAMPSFANIKHLYAADFASLTPTADKESTNENA